MGMHLTGVPGTAPDAGYGTLRHAPQVLHNVMPLEMKDHGKLHKKDGLEGPSATSGDQTRIGAPVARPAGTRAC